MATTGAELQILGRIPPQAVEIEEAIIGAILVDADALVTVMDAMKPEMFYRNHHQNIFQAIADLFQQNKKIDILTVCDQLSSTGKLEEIGGPATLAKLTQKVSSAAHIEHHVAILHEKYIQRELIRMGSDLYSNAFDNEADVDDIISQAEAVLEQVNNILSSGAQGQEMPELIASALDLLDERASNAASGKQNGISTPLFDLTRITHGWQKGDFILLAARPSMGKTAFAIEIMKKAAQKNWVLFFSLEMTREKIADRMIVGESGVNSDNYQDGIITQQDYMAIDNARDRLRRLKIKVYDQGNISIDQIKAIAKNNQRKGKCDMIVIDYLGLIKPPQTNRQYNRVQEVGEVSRRIKAMAKELDVPVIALSQLNRSCESRPDRKPHLSDLRDSGDIEQDADIVMLMFRPGRYPDVYNDPEDHNKGSINIEKNRNGRTGEVRFVHNENLTRFYDEDKANDMKMLITQPVLQSFDFTAAYIQQQPF